LTSGVWDIGQTSGIRDQSWGFWVGTF